MAGELLLTLLHSVNIGESDLTKNAEQTLMLVRF